MMMWERGEVRRDVEVSLIQEREKKKSRWKVLYEQAGEERNQKNTRTRDEKENPLGACAGM